MRTSEPSPSGNVKQNETLTKDEINHSQAQRKRETKKKLEKKIKSMFHMQQKDEINAQQILETVNAKVSTDASKLTVRSDILPWF